MISVSEALTKVFALATPLDKEFVPLRHASGRVLAAPTSARRNQPPFAASVMDGYAIPTESIATGDTFEVIGEAAAGHRFGGTLTQGQAVRIFTGAPLPIGAKRVVIQEDISRDADVIKVSRSTDSSLYIRDEGADFKVNDTLAPARRLSPRDIALIAAMNHSEVTVTRRPIVALMATGDELVMPGEHPNADQIIASNTFGLAAMLEEVGAEARMLPISRDTTSSLSAIFDLTGDADLVVTVGGASVGDHDMVGRVASSRGLERSFYKVAMRPGKPLMAGRLGKSVLLGLPGNPVSAMVCGRIFMLPLIESLLGLPKLPAIRKVATLTMNLAANGAREHYMRAQVSGGQVAVSDRQDSALLSVLSDANALVVRPPADPAKSAGESVEYIDL